MRSVHNEQKRGSSAPSLEWRTADSEDEWQTPAQDGVTTKVLPPEDRPHSNWFTRFWPIGVALLLLLVAGTLWTWSVAQSGIVQIDADLHDAVEVDLRTTATQDDGLWPASEQEKAKSFISEQAADIRPLTTSVQFVGLPGETAIVQLVTPLGADHASFRQTRFYRHTGKGWMRTKPDAELWGAPRELESTHFIFEFRQNDAQVVTTVAPQIDALYDELVRNFGTIPQPQKLIIEISVAAITGAIPLPRTVRDPFIVPSPAVYMAPVELSDTTILAQSIALPLIDYVGDRAIEDHAIPSSWLPLVRGVRLWQLWKLDLPLAHWQPELVKWLYLRTPLATGEQQAVLPDSYAELCAMHRLWMLSPVSIGIPFDCTSLDATAWSRRQRPLYAPPMRLDQLLVPLPAFVNLYALQTNNSYLSSEAVVLATLIDYAVDVYGDERLPLLLARLSQHNDWETLVPSVFGISSSDFEAGWHSYLVKKYNAPQ